MLPKPPRRRPNPRKPDLPVFTPSSGPTGPAGGDLAGTYPNPTVVALSHVAAGGSLSGTMDAPTVNSIAGLAAGGDLSGTYPAPVVNSIAHVTIGPANYPPGNGANITGIPPPATLGSGVVGISGSGYATIDVPGYPGQVQAVVCSWNTAGTGVLTAQYTGGGTEWVILSSAGPSDMGSQVNWISF